MDSKNTEIIEAAGRIIMKSGTKGLSLDALLCEPKIKEKNYLKNLKNKEDIFEVLLLNFEVELIGLLVNVAKEGNSPDVELEVLFKRLYALFETKPWNLSLIFDNNLLESYSWFKKSILRIRLAARYYLTRLVERGKKERIFKTPVNTNLLVKGILESFRSLMNDYQLGHKMISDLKKFQQCQD